MPCLKVEPLNFGETKKLQQKLSLKFNNFLFCFVVHLFVFYFEPGHIFSLDVFPSLIFEDRREVPRGQSGKGDR